MKRQPPTTRGDTPPAPRPCPACGAPLRFSHREQLRGGTVRVVLRCSACGEVVSHAAAASDDRPRMRSRKPPVDEGPPQNTVLDADTARRLLERIKGDDGEDS